MRHISDIPLQEMKDNLNNFVEPVTEDEMKKHFDTITEKKREEALESAHRIDELKDPIYIPGYKYIFS